MNNNSNFCSMNCRATGGKFYIAYGSNLNREQMRMRCPTATPVAAATLKDYRLMFRGSEGYAVATIEPHKGSSVPVVIWIIQPLDERSLDRYEGYPSLYRKEKMTIIVCGLPREAMVYIMNEQGHPYGSPSYGYLSTIREGYEDFELDDLVLDEAVKASKEARKRPKLPRKVRSQLISLQVDYSVNPLDANAVHQMAEEKGYHELATYLDEHLQEYAHYILWEK